MNEPKKCTEVSLKTLPLNEFHEKAGAKFGAFAGWSMPLSYPLGVMKEHLHTREKAGLFDISHMQLIQIEGDESINFLSYALPLDAQNLAIGQSRYNYLLDESAGILDDLIVTRINSRTFILVANAAMADADFAILKDRSKNFSVQVKKLDRVFLALQGPKAFEILKNLNFLDMNIDDLSFMQGKLTKQDLFIARSGYTGEDGFEIALPLDKASVFTETLLANDLVEWIGLAARDSLRLEAGLCLYGQDITKEDTPLEAGLLWAIPKSVREGAQFVGAEALLSQIKIGPQKRRVGLKIETKQPVRAGAKIFSKIGEEVGYVTSGGFGPSFQGPIAMGYVKNMEANLGTELYALVRDRQIPMIVYKLPFIAQNYVKH